VQYIGSTPTAILGALEPVTAVLIGVTVFSEALNMRIVIGLLIIILAVTLVVAAGSINTYLVRFKKLFPRLNKKKSV
jgi:drug/metabolite transporter (DMT)-like permease